MVGGRHKLEPTRVPNCYLEHNFLDVHLYLHLLNLNNCTPDGISALAAYAVHMHDNHGSDRPSL